MRDRNLELMISWYNGNTSRGLGELEKAVESPVGLCSHTIPHSPKLPLVFL